MIDDYKIKKASRMYADEVFESRKYDENHLQPHHIAFIEGNAAGFEAGAKWAISEFLKNLWHDIFNERIPPGKRVIVEYTFKGGIYYRSIEIPGDIQWVRGFSCEKRLRRWLYVDDLFPKEEHEQY